MPLSARAMEDVRPVGRLAGDVTLAGRLHQDLSARLLTVAVVVALASAQVEGYLMEIHPALAKVAPGLLLLLWVVQRLWTGSPLGSPHPVVLALAGLAVVVLVSASVNGGADALSATLRWLPFLVLTVALVDVLSHDVHPRAALTALLAGALAAGGGALFSFVVMDSPRASGPLEDPNDLAYVLTAAVPVALVRLGATRGRRAWWWATALGVLLAGSAATVSRGGALAVVVALVYVGWRRLVPVRLLAGGIAAVMLLTSMVLLVAQSQVEVAIDQKRYIAATNIETRTLRWEAALRMLGDNMVLGVGPGGQPERYVEYSGLAELAETNPVTHQMYFEVGAELGLPGLALFLAVIVGALVAAELTITRLRRANAPPGDITLLAAYSCQGSLLAICTSSFFLSQEYYMPLWATVAVAVALEIRTRGSGVRTLVRAAR